MVDRRPLASSFFVGIALMALGIVFLMGWWQYLMRWGDGNQRAWNQAPAQANN
ncbi:MAG: hypothetical protein AABY18_09770 [Candidatus Thermoplasmatota archaeon]